uniref:probable voltage-dependent R-type calcium channel subunit alpha-1E isoform X2 n=1 Tax=Ciona intestinalis TaxID=7719 RepID=UPI000EF4F2B2|nr:probable voltage-dependent R-type calcium channel subunit alpha-1E isoform X2 [Ciona intestinalis]|eukprot:XP_026695305.1 probable voltage-dependent R-type calcium channel subunit alpha-1E isoform X2 [Ciona intestinalis]
MNMPINEEKQVHFTTTLLALIRTSLKIKMLPQDAAGIDKTYRDQWQLDQELRQEIRLAWPNLNEKKMNLLLPPEGETQFTVGKVYGAMLVYEHWRAYKSRRDGKNPTLGQRPNIFPRMAAPATSSNNTDPQLDNPPIGDPLSSQALSMVSIVSAASANAGVHLPKGCNSLSPYGSRDTTPYSSPTTERRSKLQVPHPYKHDYNGVQIPDPRIKRSFSTLPMDPGPRPNSPNSPDMRGLGEHAVPSFPYAVSSSLFTGNVSDDVTDDDITDEEWDVVLRPTLTATTASVHRKITGDSPNYDDTDDIINDDVNEDPSVEKKVQLFLVPPSFHNPASFVTKQSTSDVNHNSINGQLDPILETPEPIRNENMISQPITSDAVFEQPIGNEAKVFSPEVAIRSFFSLVFKPFMSRDTSEQSVQLPVQKESAIYDVTSQVSSSLDSV